MTAVAAVVMRRTPQLLMPQRGIGRRVLPSVPTRPWIKMYVLAEIYRRCSNIDCPRTDVFAVFNPNGLRAAEGIYDCVFTVVSSYESFTSYISEVLKK